MNLFQISVIIVAVRVSQPKQYYLPLNLGFCQEKARGLFQGYFDSQSASPLLPPSPEKGFIMARPNGYY